MIQGQENLIPVTERTAEEQIAISRQGGIASGKVRKRNADIRNSLKMLMAMGAEKAAPEDLLNYMAAWGVDSPTMAEAIAAAAILKSAGGDMEAARFVRDSSGELPTNKVELSGDVNRPIAQLDLATLTDEQLRQLADRAQGDDV